MFASLEKRGEEEMQGEWRGRDGREMEDISSSCLGVKKLVKEEDEGLMSYFYHFVLFFNN